MTFSKLYLLNRFIVLLLHRHTGECGLRDYGTGTWEGGDSACDHSHFLGGNGVASSKQVTSGGTQKYKYKDVCGKCGAARVDEQLGLERTPEEYVAKIVEGFREVRRVLRKDGTCWLNLGDSYTSHRPRNSEHSHSDGVSSQQEAFNAACRATDLRGSGTYKDKDLVGIPWMTAFALRADGWWLRQDIIWAKPNPMPESVTDRCTKSHEYIFLLTKSADYFCDMEALKERAQNAGKVVSLGAKSMSCGQATANNVSPSGNGKADTYTVVSARNKRSVWTVATQPYSEAHFATFPPKLIEPCILAGTSEKGCCAKCGAPWGRVVEKTGGRDWRTDRMVLAGVVGELSGEGSYKRGRSAEALNDTQTIKTVSWQPTCKCSAEVVPCTVLDPFCGAGTTGLVCSKFNRDFIGTELNTDYVKMAEKRIVGAAPMFNSVETHFSV